ncbi:MAG TPA: ElyC/SanA/YdcF family protein [Candidatus Dormibacteraeota bacterium]|nr:ElyC/SanA/YdcF family protein [Candidatus Dormibacteraeota bacterium]
MVVEGWAPDFALRQAMAEFGREHYDKLYVTGGPLEQGAPLSEFKTYAELGTATLVKFGFRTNDVQPVPAPGVAKDRTYSSAVALREWWQQHGEPMPASLNLITLGPHARRSRLLFEKAMGKKVAVGVISIDEHGYDQKHWWRTSQGVRTTIGEAVAYLYARLWFRAPKA